MNGTAVDLNKRDTPLDVKLEMVGNSEVKATLTNNGASALKLFKVGSILDKTAVEKTEVNSAGTYPTSDNTPPTPKHPSP
ncbi:hypothetical protein SLS55_003785 [Diplodia seriata]|uniref:Uncharacterized protein n=1 Tax=Diplodia seriata TaxID=420778 RepID=A0ABR3CP60_9PEZI